MRPWVQIPPPRPFVTILVMLGVFTTSLVGVLVLWLAEVYRRNHKVSNELARKIIHTVHALVVVCWAWFVSYEFIIWAEVLFLAVVIVARHKNFMPWLRRVNRISWGEFFFPAGIIAAALLEPPVFVFAIALLHVGIADSLAAIIGKNYGKKYFYKIHGYQKSFAGLAAFWTASLLILTIFIAANPEAFDHAAWTLILFLPLSLTALEGLSIWGSDNLTIPLAVTVSLTSLL